MVDEADAPIVRPIFREAAAGTSLRALASALTAEGIPTPTGAPARHRSSLHQMLKNPAYTGEAVAYRWRRRGKNAAGLSAKTRVLRPDAENIPLPPGTVPSLVSAETFAAVQARLARNKQEATRNNRHPESALLRAGFAVCGYCGRNMKVQTAPHGDRYVCRASIEQRGRCSRHAIPTITADAEVWQQVSAFLLTPTLIERKLAELRASDPTEADLAALDAQRAEVSRKRHNLLDRLADTDDADLAALIMEKAAGFGATLASLDTERDAVLARRAAWERSASKLADLSAWCKTVAERLAGATYQTKRWALEYLDVRLKMYRQDAPERIVVEALSVTEDGDIVSALGRGGSR